MADEDLKLSKQKCVIMSGLKYLKAHFSEQKLILQNLWKISFPSMYVFVLLRCIKILQSHF